MYVGSVDVRAPGNNVFGIAKLLRLGPNIASCNRRHASAAGRSADGAIQLRSAQPMEEPVCHARITQHAHVSRVGIRKDRLRTELVGNFLEACADFLQRLVPGDSREVARDRKSTRLNSSHGYISYAVFCL